MEQCKFEYQYSKGENDTQIVKYFVERELIETSTFNKNGDLISKNLEDIDIVKNIERDENGKKVKETSNYDSYKIYDKNENVIHEKDIYGDTMDYVEPDEDHVKTFEEDAESVEAKQLISNVYKNGKLYRNRNSIKVNDTTFSNIKKFEGDKKEYFEFETVNEKGQIVNIAKTSDNRIYETIRDTKGNIIANKFYMCRDKSYHEYDKHNNEIKSETYIYDELSMVKTHEITYNDDNNIITDVVNKYSDSDEINEYINKGETLLEVIER